MVGDIDWVEIKTKLPNRTFKTEKNRFTDVYYDRNMWVNRKYFIYFNTE